MNTGQYVYGPKKRKKSRHDASVHAYMSRNSSLEVLDHLLWPVAILEWSIKMALKLKALI